VIAPVLSAAHAIAQRAYPKSFRERFGREMTSVFRARISAMRAQGRLRTVALGLWLCADAVASGTAERAHLFVRRTDPGAYAPDARPLPIECSGSRLMSVESFISDLRLALRRLRRAPVFAAATIATLGLGIGANTAIFSVANAVLLKPLPYRDPGRLVAIWSNNTHQNEPRNPVSPANFEAFRREAGAFAGVEAMYSFLINTQLELPGGVETVSSTSVTAGMFDLIGRSAVYGRVLRAGDDHAVVLSHAFWTRSFSADPNVIGRTVKVPGVVTPYEIVGVMPEDFVFPYKSMLGPSGFIRALSADVWLLLPTNTGRFVDAAGQPVRTVHYLTVIGRLKPDQTLAQAQSQLAAVAERRAADFKETNDGWTVTSLPLHEQVVGRVRPAVVLLLAGVGLLLLMTCLNIANVLLARATGRQRDLAVRAALGASGGRLVQQALVESLTIAFFGALAGSLVVIAGTRVIVSLAPTDLPRLAETSSSWPVVAFALVLSGVTGLVVGLLPAIASRRARVDGLRESHRTTASAARARVRSTLVMAEVALATVLTIGTGLLVRSFVAVMNVDPGFDAAQVLTFQQNVPPRITTPGGRVAFLDEFMGKVSAIPGVSHVGGTTRIPLGSTQVTTQLTVDGRDVPPASLPEVDMRRAVGNYFQTMNIPVVQGRAFESNDRTSTEGFAVVNAALARQVFKDERVVGRRVKMGPPSPDTPWLTIIGVVGDVRHMSLEEQPRPEIYITYLQGPPVSPFFAVRSGGDPLALVSGVRQAARDMGADPPYNVSTLNNLRSESVALRRFTVLLAALFGVLALVLAGVGIYGVMALVVAERTDEVGVRMALGATPSRILSMLVGQAGRLGILGVGIGLAGGLAVAQISRRLLFGIEPTDVVTFVAVPALLLAVALLAAFIPARRATKISPVEAMRS